MQSLDQILNKLMMQEEQKSEVKFQPLLDQDDEDNQIGHDEAAPDKEVLSDWQEQEGPNVEQQAAATTNNFVVTKTVLHDESMLKLIGDIEQVSPRPDQADVVGEMRRAATQFDFGARNIAGEKIRRRRDHLNDSNASLDSMHNSIRKSDNMRNQQSQKNASSAFPARKWHNKKAEIDRGNLHRNSEGSGSLSPQPAQAATATVSPISVIGKQSLNQFWALPQEKEKHKKSSQQVLAYSNKIKPKTQMSRKTSVSKRGAQRSPYNPNLNQARLNQTMFTTAHQTSSKFNNKKKQQQSVTIDEQQSLEVHSQDAEQTILKSTYSVIDPIEKEVSQVGESLQEQQEEEPQQLNSVVNMISEQLASQLDMNLTSEQQKMEGDTAQEGLDAPVPPDKDGINPTNEEQQRPENSQKSKSKEQESKKLNQQNSEQERTQSKKSEQYVVSLADTSAPNKLETEAQELIDFQVKAGSTAEKGVKIVDEDHELKDHGEKEPADDLQLVDTQSQKAQEQPKQVDEMSLFVGPQAAGSDKFLGDLLGEQQDQYPDDSAAVEGQHDGENTSRGFDHDRQKSDKFVKTGRYQNVDLQDVDGTEEDGNSSRPLILIKKTSLKSQQRIMTSHDELNKTKVGLPGARTSFDVNIEADQLNEKSTVTLNALKSISRQNSQAMWRSGEDFRSQQLSNKSHDEQDFDQEDDLVKSDPGKSAKINGTVSHQKSNTLKLAQKAQKEVQKKGSQFLSLLSFAQHADREDTISQQSQNKESQASNHSQTSRKQIQVQEPVKMQEQNKQKDQGRFMSISEIVGQKRQQKGFTNISNKQRKEQMQKLIKELARDSEEYFTGKELQFENNQTYIQCIRHPCKQNAFISVQDVQRTQSDQKPQVMKLKNLNDATADEYQGHKQFFKSAIPWQSTASIYPRSSIEEEESQDESASQTTLISIWTKEQDQYQCQAPLPIESHDILKRTINGDAKQVLYPGESGTNRLFFFRGLKTAIQRRQTRIKEKREKLQVRTIFKSMDVIKFAVKDFSQEDKDLITDENVELASYEIPPQGELQDILEKLIFPTKVRKFCLPEPALVTLGEDSKQLYLVMTQVVEETSVPSVYFFKCIDEGEKKGTIQGQATLTFDGAEMYLNQGPAGELRFVTNERNFAFFLDRVSGLGASYSRLVSPPILVESKYDKESDQYCWQKDKKRYLVADTDSMDFFRCQTHLYPYVQAVAIDHDVTLRFYGSDRLQSASISFQPKSQADQHQTMMSGYFLNEESEQIQLDLEYENTEPGSKTHNCSGKLKRFKGQIDVEIAQRGREAWDFVEWPKTQGKLSRKFQIKQVKFFDGASANGELQEVLISYESSKYTLIPRQVNEASTFSGERLINLSSRTNDALDIQLTGCLISGPFDSKLIGQIIQGEEETRFTIRKRMNCSATFFLESSQRKFDIEVSGGVIFDRSGQVSLSAETHQERALTENVHKVSTDGQSVHILHGSLSELQQRQKIGRYGKAQESKLFLTSLTQKVTLPVENTLNKKKARGGKRLKGQKTGSIVIDKSVLKDNQEETKEEKKEEIVEIIRKRVNIQAEHDLKDLLSSSEILKNENGVIQDMLAQENDLTFPVFQKFPNAANISSIKFIRDSLRANLKSQNAGRDQDGGTQVQGNILQSWMIDYPLLAYKSFLPDNSEIHLSNLAQEQKQRFLIKLGDLSLISFVSSVYLTKILTLESIIEPLACQILFLARQKHSQKILLMMLTMDPWSTAEPDSLIQIKVIKTCHFKLPPLPVQDIKSINLLAYRPRNEDYEMALLFQYSEQIWSVSLSHSDSTMSQVIDPTVKKIAPRYVVRKKNDISHVYCITETTSSMAITKIELGSISSDELLVTDIYEMHSSKIILIEPDPENPKILFALDDELKILLIEDKKDGKAHVRGSIDLSILHPQLERKLLIFSNERPWASISISQDVMTFEGHSYSLSTKFNYELKPSWSEHEQLVEDRNIPGTLFSLQVCHPSQMEKSAYMFRCKPLQGCNLVDLIGQSRVTKQTKLFLTADVRKKFHPKDHDGSRKPPTSLSQLSSDNSNKIEEQLILVNTENRVLVFNERGYYQGSQSTGFGGQNKCLRYEQKQLIMLQSSENDQYGKFMLVQEIKDPINLQEKGDKEFSLIQFRPDGDLVQILKHLSITNLKHQIRASKQQIIEEEESHRNSNMPRIFAQKRRPQELLEEEDMIRAQNLIQSGKFKLLIGKQNRIITQNGLLVLIGSIVDAQTTREMTIFHPRIQQQETYLQDVTHTENGGRKYFAAYRLKQILVIFIICSSKEEQDELDFVVKKVDGSQSKRQNKEDVSPVASSIKKKKEDKKANFTFGVVEDRFIWLNHERRLIQHFDLAQVLSDENDGFVKCHIVQQISGFTVREVFRNLAEEMQSNIDINISIDEIPQNSFLRKGKVLQDSQGDEKLMQLSIGNFLTVYNLDKDFQREVAMLQEADKFTSPIIFSCTGFVYNSQNVNYQCNKDHTLGILYQKFGSGIKGSLMSQGLHRPYAEIDFQQLKKIQDVILKKDVYTKRDIGEIEPSTFVQIFRQDTFFTIFGEQSIVYEVVFDQLQALRNSSGASEQDDQNFLKVERRLKYVVDLPTPVLIRTVDKKKNVDSVGVHQTAYDLSIIRQSLLFADEKATEFIFKIADIVNLGMDDYISNQDDLEMLTQRLPHQYASIINKLSTNMHTSKLQNAMMAKSGDKSMLDTFIQHSEVISDLTPKLRLQINTSEQREDERMRSVQISMIPMKWIFRQNGDYSQLYKFFKNHYDDLQGTILQEAIFDALWKHEQPLIFTAVFMPYLVYFITVNFYFAECMVRDLNRPIGLFSGYCGEDNPSCFEVYMEPYLRLVFVVLLTHQILIEFTQIYNDLEVGYLWKLSNWSPLKLLMTKHFEQQSNKIDLASLFCNVLVLWMLYMEVEIFKIRIIASIAIVLIWMQLLFWFRLSDSLAQHVDLIIATITDIGGFMFVLGTFLLMFSSGFYMLQINRLLPNKRDHEPVADDLYERAIFPYEDEFGSLYMEGIWNQYLLILGDFGTFSFERSNSDQNLSFWQDIENKLVTIFFLLSTFLTNIVILNMLIAIMSATFDNHKEQQHESKIKQRLNVQSEFVFLIQIYEKIFCCRCSKKSQVDQAGYLFAIQPLEMASSSQESQASGGSGAASGAGGDVFSQKFRDLESLIAKKVLRNVQDLSKEVRERLDFIERGNEAFRQEILMKIKKSKDDVNEKTGSVETDIASKLDKLETTLTNNQQEEREERVKLADSIEKLKKKQSAQKKAQTQSLNVLKDVQRSVKAIMQKGRF